MAASSVLVGNALGVSYQIGVDSKGNDVFKGKSFKNISNYLKEQIKLFICSFIYK